MRFEVFTEVAFQIVVFSVINHPGGFISYLTALPLARIMQLNLSILAVAYRHYGVSSFLYTTSQPRRTHSVTYHFS